MSMSEHCDHCGERIDGDQEWVGGDQGVYCSQVCWYDEEVLGVDADELPPDQGARRIEP